MAENFTKKTARALDLVSVAVFTATALPTGYEVVKKQPRRAAAVGLAGAAIATALKLEGVLYERCAEKISIRREIVEEKPFDF